MSTQTRTWQRRVLAEAARDGFAGLYWYIECEAVGRRVFPAAYPGIAIPVVPVGPDPEISRHWAHLLAVLFADTNPPALHFEPQLTALDSLVETRCTWYEWGTLDIVCEACGAVGWDSCCCVSNVRSVEWK